MRKTQKPTKSYSLETLSSQNIFFDFTILKEKTINMPYNLKVRNLQILLLKSSCSTHPVSPSTVSSMGRTWMRLPYLTSGHGCTETTSLSRTLRLFRMTLFMRIFSSEQVSSARTMLTVSFLRLPFRSTVSPLNSCSWSIFAYTSLTFT